MFVLLFSIPKLLELVHSRLKRSIPKCEQNTNKVQCGITNPEEDGSLKDQDSNVESVPSVSNEELEEFNAGEKVDDYEILENIISNVCGLFMEESVE
uniref:Uncharacterized protein n=1 Tax=Cucumis melo TaxID=3656 RepID=A0A9I9EFY7_CUCME